MKPFPFPVLLLLSLALLTGVEPQGECIRFLVAERPEYVLEHDSYVVVISRPEHLRQARRILAEGPWNLEVTPVTGVEWGKDGINRNLLAPGQPEWTWHQTAFYGFGSVFIPEWPGSPTEFEQWGQIFLSRNPHVVGFAAYTIVAELGPALCLETKQEADNLKFTWADLGTNYVYTLKMADALTSTNWTAVAGAAWPMRTNQ